MKNAIIQVKYFLNSYCFTFILLHIERKWLLKKNIATISPLNSKLSAKFQRFNAIHGSIKMLKKVEFQKLSIKMKNFKSSSSIQWSAWKKLFRPLPGESFSKVFDGDLQEYTDICFSSALRMQFLGF